MRIVLFGGTFDPVHSEHVKMAQGALKELSPDKLIVLPSYIPPHKAAAAVSAADRLQMAKIAFGFDDRIEISDYEICRGGNSYTYLTAEYFRSLYPNSDLYFLLGGDSFFDFEKWVHPEIIAKIFKIVVVARGDKSGIEMQNDRFENTFGYRAKILSVVGDEMSSTFIRYCLYLGERDIGLPEGVGDYIAKKGLYKGGELFDYISANLKHKRRIHTAGVIECALKLNEQLGLDRNQVITAAALHDVAKYMNAEDFPAFKLEDGMPQSVIHAFLGEWVAREVLGITDGQILSAIRYHTTGKPNMTPLEKLIYTADLIERGRDYPSVERLKKITYADFERGFIECVKDGYKHLKQSKLPGGTYYLTKDAYEYYKDK